MSLKSFFNPKSVAVVGVSENLEKLGSVIFQNIIEAKYAGKLWGVNPKLAGQTFLSHDCFDSIVSVPETLDLVIIVVPGKYVEGVIDDCVEQKVKNVIIISAGFGEVGNHALENAIQKKCINAGINLLGPNCLGALFPYSGLNASFADGFPKPGNICFVSQSGAFCTAMLDWAAQKDIGFSHFISLGNKAGISEIDILKHLGSDPKIGMFAFYLESLADGPAFLEQIKKIAPHKPIIILEPGKSVKAAEAASSHTGALAPNARVLQMAYTQSGALQVFSMRAMFGLLETLTYNAKKNFGKNLAIVTNAGGVGVLTTDLSEENHLDLASFDKKTLALLEKELPAEANIKNPVDIIGDARADRYQQALEILVQDKNVDQILVLLTPQRTTEIKKTAQIIGEIAKTTDKNIVASFVGGQKTSLGVPVLASQTVPHFDFPVDATRVLGLLANRSVGKKTPSYILKRDKTIEKFIQEAQKKGLKSLPQKQVNHILAHYGFDFPHNCNFKNYDDALLCAQEILKKSPVVMKFLPRMPSIKPILKG